MNRHQVVGFPSGLREPSLQELIKRLQLLQPPVLASPHFAQMLSQFHKPGIALVLMPCLPGQDRVDLAQHLLGTTAIQLGRHGRILSSQVRQTDQDRLPACGSAQPPPVRAGRDRARERDRWYTGSGGSGCRCEAGTVQTRSDGLVSSTRVSNSCRCGSVIVARRYSTSTVLADENEHLTMLSADRTAQREQSEA